MKSIGWVFVLMALLGSAELTETAGEYTAERAGMIKAIESDVRATSQWIGKQILDPRVMAVMGKVPRHQFVPKNQIRNSYENRPLPIGHGQTISQPYIVALMTDLARPNPDSVVLEIGTGSGYQAAILAELVKRVYTVEIIPELGTTAADRLRRMGYDNLEVRVGDGYYGWEEHAPFDAIVVTAAPDHIPPPLIKQLKPGGVIVIPVGGRFMTQQLMVVEKDDQGTVRSRQMLPVRFVPLTGGH